MTVVAALVLALASLLSVVASPFCHGAAALVAASTPSQGNNPYVFCSGPPHRHQLRQRQSTKRTPKLTQPPHGGAVAPSLVLQAGFGGGGGGQYQNSDGSVADFGGGCGCGALPDGLPTSCGSAPDTDSETLLRDWLAQGAAVLAATPACQSGMTLCGSGGGGGGYTSSNGCPGGFGGGFGFEFAPVSLSQQGGDGGVGVVLGLGDDDGASCSAQTPGGNPPPSASIGPAARTCGTQCATSSAFNGCFCPCFKDKMVTAGVPWAKQINCNT